MCGAAIFGYLQSNAKTSTFLLDIIVELFFIVLKYEAIDSK